MAGDARVAHWYVCGARTARVSSPSRMSAAPVAVVGRSQALGSSKESVRRIGPMPGRLSLVGVEVGPGVQVEEGMTVGNATVVVAVAGGTSGEGAADGGVARHEDIRPARPAPERNRTPLFTERARPATGRWFLKGIGAKVRSRRNSRRLPASHAPARTTRTCP